MVFMLVSLYIHIASNFCPNRCTSLYSSEARDIYSRTKNIRELRSHYGDGNENVTKQQDFMRKTHALYARYKLWYISLSCMANNQRKMTKLEDMKIDFSFSVSTCSVTV